MRENDGSACGAMCPAVGVEGVRCAAGTGYQARPVEEAVEKRKVTGGFPLSAKATDWLESTKAYEDGNCSRRWVLPQADKSAG